jgi:hypothetical protein
VFYRVEEQGITQNVVSEAAGLSADAQVNVEYTVVRRDAYEARLKLVSMRVEHVKVALSQSFEQTTGSSAAEIEEKYRETLKNALENQKQNVENQEVIIKKAQEGQIAISSPFTGDTLLKPKEGS